MTSGKIVEHNINYSSTNIEENDRKFLSNIALRVLHKPFFHKIMSFGGAGNGIM